MEMNRRKFLKLGTAAVAGLGVAAASTNPAVAAAGQDPRGCHGSCRYGQP